MRARGARCLAVLALVVVGGARADEPETYSNPDDPMLHGDVLDPQLDRAAEILPGAPWIRPGPDGELGTSDDVIYTQVRGDVDIVIRTGRLAIDGAIPDPTALPGAIPIPRGVVETFAEGVPIDFVVVPSDGREPAPYGSLAVPGYFEALPILVAAFPDLDGDGYVGITLLDGDATDDATEAAELTPVGVRYAYGADGAASASLFLGAGGPPGAELRVAFTAMAYAGPLLDSAAIAADGPAVMTRMPFLPVTELERVIIRGPRPPSPPGKIGAVGTAIFPTFLPDPRDSRIGEAFTLRLDGSDPSIDVAELRSGAAVHVGLVRTPDADEYVAGPERPLRPALDDDGRRITVEVLSELVLAGQGRTTEVRLVSLDRLGNVTAPAEVPGVVTVQTVGGVQIAHPDRDGDPYREVVDLWDARGALLELEIEFDYVMPDPDEILASYVLLDGCGSVARIDARVSGAGGSGSDPEEGAEEEPGVQEQDGEADEDAEEEEEEDEDD